MAARAEVEGANLVGWVAKVALARRASAALPSVARALASFLVGHDPSALTRSAHQASLPRGTCAWQHGNLMMLRRATSSAQTAARRAYASGGACTLVQRRLAHRSTTVAHTLRLGGAGRPRALSSLAGSDPLLATEASSEVAQPGDAGIGDASAPDLGEAVSAAAATPPPKPPPSAGAKHSEGQLLAAYKKQDHETVLEMHAAMVDVGTAPTMATFNCVVGSKAVLSGVADAKALVVEMTEAHPHLKPTVQTYSALLKPYVTSGDAAGAEALVEEMRAAGIKPVLDTFNDLVSLYCQAKDFEKAEQLFRGMRSEEIRPSRHTYYRYINGCFRAQKADEARTRSRGIARARARAVGAALTCAGTRRRPSRCCARWRPSGASPTASATSGCSSTSRCSTTPRVRSDASRGSSTSRTSTGEMRARCVRDACEMRARW